MTLSTVLLDLDGVVRHFDPEHVLGVEHSHGLRRGALHAAAFEPELARLALTGQMTRERWVNLIGRRVANEAAAKVWMANMGSVDHEMLAEVAKLRKQGVVVAVLTNGTDTIPNEMEKLGLADKFDAIFNSAELGFAKPDRQVFEAVCSELKVQPAEVFFTDDSKSNVDAAVALGMTAELFEDLESFRSHLTAAGFTS